ncbi:ATP-binding protein [Aestuariivirga sp. YIM B02566]|uniref:AAA family ATPase n=1 Tax=Taklimakanibacter albus TaxID=2800327 RepID=A0ACC5R4K8_9HYPH|nr:ATP-binding protein [Aestuariivirga sp. YIM B02566]MBK1867569.1 AAA family ATPase [Aestuariivirga sp. YIM B02566]
MKFILEALVLFCKQSEERIEFSRHLSFFHGEMSTGKSTIAELINFCLGGALKKTPAISSEMIGTHLRATVGNTEALIERGATLSTSVEVTWKSDTESGRDNFPLTAGSQPLIGDDIFNYSDFLLRHLGSPLLKVRSRKSDPDSELHRISFRDFFKFCYLDQPDLDSSFFLLEQPVRQEKSKDVLRYVLGLHSDRLSALQTELADIRQKQRTMREAAKQIGDFLERYGFSSQEQISAEIDGLNDEEEKIKSEISQQRNTQTPGMTVAEEDAAQISALTRTIESKRQAIVEIDQRLHEQRSLIAEFITMKFKIARSSTASELLSGAEFHACPACGTELADAISRATCLLCKSDLGKAPGGLPGGNAVIERDLSDRIEDLKRSVARLDRSLERQNKEADRISVERAILQARIDNARRQVESEYIQRARKLEARRGAIGERRSLLVRIKEMPNDVERKLREADAFSAQISELEREIENEQARFEKGRQNIQSLELNFHSILQAIHFPEFKPQDRISLNQKSWLPYVYPAGDEQRAWTFNDAGSGGKMVLFKICFALALHVTAAQNSLPLPHVIIIDSPMKNITPDINPEVFEYFYQEVYRLLKEELNDWQCILIDQTYHAPPPDFGEHVERRLTKSEPKYPPLIGYYHGH